MGVRRFVSELSKFGITFQVSYQLVSQPPRKLISQGPKDAMYESFISFSLQELSR
jgi:hypothetical protein